MFEEKYKKIIAAKWLVTLTLGGLLSLILLRIAMWIYQDYSVQLDTIDGTIWYWLVALALSAAYALSLLSPIYSHEID